MRLSVTNSRFIDTHTRATTTPARPVHPLQVDSVTFGHNTATINTKAAESLFGNVLVRGEKLFAQNLLGSVKGSTLLKCKNNYKIRAVLTCENVEKGTVFRMYGSDNQVLGYIKTIDSTDKHNSSFGFPQKYSGTNSCFVFVEKVESIANDEFKGIGQALVQTAIEDSLNKGFEGKIKLLASKMQGCVRTRDYDFPLGFYYEKCHLRAEGIMENASIHRMLKYARKHNITPDQIARSECLYLAIKKVREYWQPIIKDNPILKQ